MLNKNPPQVGESSGPGGIRTLDFFSAIDIMAGVKGKKAVYYVYFVPKSPYCSSISIPELFPNCAPICIGMKQGRRSAALSKGGFDANDVLEKHRLHFSLSFH
jgi:hypothetical protein